MENKMELGGFVILEELKKKGFGKMVKGRNGIYF
jgi:hypothetical protein